MAQLAGILVVKSTNTSKKNQDVLLMTIQEAKFRSVVEPGDTLHIYTQIEQNRGAVWKFSSHAKVNDKIVSESKFSAMIKNRNE